MIASLKKITYCIIVISSLYLHGTGYVMITDIGGDIDDALAVKIALNVNRPPDAIIATHNRPLEKALIAKVIARHSGFPHIPIYVGHGCVPQDSREYFANDNKLWPSFFGFLNPTETESEWNPTQTKAYRETFEDFSEIPENVYLPCNRFDRDKSAHQMLINKAFACKEDETFDIIALAPLHDVYNALRIIKKEQGEDAEHILAQKMRLWSMGGDYSQGYNWLIAPDVTNYVLKRVQTVCVSSALIRDNGLNVLPREFAVFAKAIKRDKLAQAIFKDWVNWNQDDQLKNNKNLCDPVTLYAYLHPEIIEEMQTMAVAFPCLTATGDLNAELKGEAYFANDLEGKIIAITPAAQSNIQFIQKIKDTSALRRKLIYHIAQIFFPSLDEKIWWQNMDKQDLTPAQIAQNIEWTTSKI